MKNVIKSDHFKNYVYPCSLGTLGGPNITYGTYTVDMDKDKYNFQSFALRNGESSPMPEVFSTASYVGRDNGHFLLCTKDDQGNTTVSTSDGSSEDVKKLFTVNRSVSHPISLPDGRFLLVCYDNLRTEGLTKEQLDRQNRFYELDEYPFWFNGVGLIDRMRSRLYLWDQGELKLLTPAFMNVSAVTLLDANTVVFCGASYETLRDVPHQLWTLSLDTLEMKPVPLTEGYSYSDIVKKDADHIFCLRNDHTMYGDSQNDFIDLLDLRDGSYQRLNEDGRYCLSNALYSDIVYGTACYSFKRSGNGVYLISTVRDCGPVLYANFDTGEIETWVGEDYSVVDVVLSEDESTLYFVAENGDSAPELYAKDMASGEIRRITHLNDKVAEEYIIQPVERFTFEGSGGLPIDGYVIKPVGYEEGKKYKTVLSIHGGPNCTFGRCYYHELQYLASLGYVVLFGNPHGSVGYGAAFQDLREKYYTCDLEDILLMLKYASENLPFIDFDQMAVSGGSYGGMMVNWIITHYHFFKTAISDRGCSNEMEDFFMSDCGVTFSKDIRGGLLWDEGVFEKVWNASPIKYADKVTTPTLFVHSEKDFRCTKEQSLSLYAALKLHGVKSRAFIFKDENHGMSFSGRPQNRVARLEIMRDWLAETL